MSQREDWSKLSHLVRVRILRDSSIDQIVRDYTVENADDATFRDVLSREQHLWQVRNVGEFEYAGDPPTKDIVLGAWRDLDRAEALLELIDNSIDAWRQRRQAYPTKTAPQLDIYIDLDERAGQLTYQDNAGGVSVEKLPNLVVPGFSDATPLSHTIGSYKTGGKKAFFRLANAARIATRYWNPAETGDEAVSVQLDEAWINHPTEYRFPFARLRDKSAIERGQTNYVLQLRREPITTPWYQDPDARKEIEKQIRQTYSLLLVRNPEINIYFLDRASPIKPVEDLYDFSGVSDSDVDIRPQRVIFDAELEHDRRLHTIAIEVILGCRTSVGTKKGEKSWGIDLYGNDRLFVSHDQETFAHLLPRGNAQRLVRGLVNIKGPNIFIPWDTHKRHLNVDREITQVLTSHKLVAELFEHWVAVYNTISSAANQADLINKPLPHIFDSKKRDLAIPHDDRVPLDPRRRRGIKLPEKLFVPRIRASRSRRDDKVNVSLQFTKTEARLVSAFYGIEGDATGRELGSKIKGDVLKRAKR